MKATDHIALFKRINGDIGSPTKPEFTSKQLPKPKKRSDSKKEYLIKLDDKEYSTKVWEGK